MWMPGADDDAAPAQRRQGLGHQLAGGGEDDRGVQLLGRLADVPPAQAAPSERASAWPSSSPGLVNANTRLPWCTATWQTRCAEAPKP